MKKYIFLLLLFIPLTNTFAQVDGDYPVGKIKRDVLFSYKNKATFQPAYDSYTPKAEAVKYLKAQKGKFKIKVVMGFWCDDSKIYVPQLLKALEEAKWDTNDDDQLKIFGVDTNKFAGFEGFKSLNIEKVPTIIVYYDDREIGRIVETPKATVEEDLVAIMKSIEK